MKKALLVGVVCLMVAADQPKTPLEQNEAIIKDMVKCLNDFADALASVKDKETAKAAAGKISKTADELEALGKKAEKAPKLEDAENKKLQMKYAPELEKVTKRLMDVAFTAGVNSGGEPTFLEALKKIEKVGGALQKIGGGK